MVGLMDQFPQLCILLILLHYPPGDAIELIWKFVNAMKKVHLCAS